MLIPATTTADAIALRQPEVLIVPALFDEPEGGYVAWLQSQVPDPRNISPGTIPDRIIQAEGAARYWGTLLPKIMTGQYEMELMEPYGDDDPAVQEIKSTDWLGELLLIATNTTHLPTRLTRAATAKYYRLLFDGGRPLYIGIYQNDNRYRRLVPVLRFLGNGKYMAGSREHHRGITATDHADAIRQAREWYVEEHEAEVDEAKQQARAIQVPRMVIDLLAAVLERDGQITDQHGTMVAWKNGNVHGRFGVVSVEWAYLFKGSPRTAATMLAASIKEAAAANAHAPLRLEHLANNVHVYLGLSVKDDNLLYAGGHASPHPERENNWGVFLTGQKRPNFQVSVQPVKNGAFDVEVSTVPERPGQKPVLMGKSVSPVGWGLTRLDCLSWGVWFGLEKEKTARK